MDFSRSPRPDDTPIARVWRKFHAMTIARCEPKRWGA